MFTTWNNMTFQNFWDFLICHRIGRAIIKNSKLLTLVICMQSNVLEYKSQTFVVWSTTWSLHIYYPLLQSNQVRFGRYQQSCRENMILVRYTLREKRCTAAQSIGKTNVHRETKEGPSCMLFSRPIIRDDLLRIATFIFRFSLKEKTSVNNAYKHKTKTYIVGMPVGA